jgi:hypothetical protein
VWGSYCDRCDKSTGKCLRQPGGGLPPLEEPCEKCAGKGCEACNYAGKVDVYGCPWDRVDNQAAEALEMARLYEDGILPVAGGVLDQAHSGLEAIQHARSAEAAFKANFMKGLKR